MNDNDNISSPLRLHLYDFPLPSLIFVKKEEKNIVFGERLLFESCSRRSTSDETKIESI